MRRETWMHSGSNKYLYQEDMKDDSEINMKDDAGEGSQECEWWFQRQM